MEHYYSAKQTSEFRVGKIGAVLRKKEFSFYTGSGVFSVKKVDKGTEVLINYCIVKDGWDVLDMGCGYGAVGVVIKKLFPKCNVVMSDVNKRALQLAKMNCRLNKVKCDVLGSDLYGKINLKFDSILSNPPQSAGKKICYQIVAGAFDFLKSGGMLQLVARHNKGGKDLNNRMKEVFGNVKDIAKKGGYRIYISKKQ